MNLSPETVSLLSDDDLSARLAAALFGGLMRENGKVYVRHGGGYRILSPSLSSSVLFVVEHMRQRWAKADGASRLYWTLDDHGVDFFWRVIVSDGGPEVVAQVEHRSQGRAVFEAALLSLQENGS